MHLISADLDANNGRVNRINRGAIVVFIFWLEFLVNIFKNTFFQVAFSLTIVSSMELKIR